MATRSKIFFLIGFLLFAFFIGATIYWTPDFFRSWPPKDYAEARAFIYNLDGTHSGIIIDGELNPTVLNPEGVKLTADQVQKIGHAMMDPRLPGQPTACSFHPRHGIVFYDSNHRPMAWGAICLECRMYQLFPKQKHHTVDWEKLREIFRSAGLPVFENPSDYDVLKDKDSRTNRFKMLPNEETSVK